MEQTKQSRTILVTGGAGFIGSHFIHRWHAHYPHDHILNVDKLGYASNLDYVKGLSPGSYTFLHADLADKEKIHNLLVRYEPDHIFHFAAESHVDQSIKSPEAFVSSNINGTFHLLEAVRHLWTIQNRLHEARFVHISTDEVYGSLRLDEPAFIEESLIKPNSPYSASKAASDHLVRAYHKTYGLQTLTTRCSNNFGPHQHQEKLIPTIIHRAIHHQPIPIYGEGKQIRDWLYVLDHCEAINLVFNKGRAGEVYNLGASNEWANLQLTSYICDQLNEIKPSKKLKDYKELITFTDDRAGHDFRYGMDASKAASELNWKPRYSFKEAMKTTIDWYLAKYEGEREIDS
ncbi:dTDP-glucose 4,6-dehydratase [Falsibacillus pallidus]|uniref:dTDP-glucose 4,6-dehydratase n=1 Tax=Falsibacillus pallidus TaxID=493781 RepID=A0A370GAN5_9BACI|nr:dTDP-glucose 4,6-dehydratase [Falsibacillus pallidus]RDI40109.1 dTDP-glucose 4,6-dehydratase [Falsibacillus pallidus]